MRQLDYAIQYVEAIPTILFYNHGHVAEYMRSDDMEFLKQHLAELTEGITEENRSEFIVSHYRQAKENGCLEVLRPKVPTTGFLKMRPTLTKSFDLVLTYGKKEVILIKNKSLGEVKAKYLDLMKKQQEDPRLFQSIWEYAEQKHKLEVSNAV